MATLMTVNCARRRDRKTLLPLGGSVKGVSWLRRYETAGFGWLGGLRGTLPVSFRQGRRGVCGCCTTRFENAHGNSSQELVYRWHPWCDRRVWVREAIEKPGGLVFRCALSDSAADRGLEVPAWMFDRAACAERAMLSDAPFARMAALSALTDLLAGALKARASPSSNLPLFGASRVSRDQNRGDPHAGKENCASKAVGAEGGRTRPSAPIDEPVGVVRRRSARLHNRSADVAGPAERDAACPDGADGAAAHRPCRPKRGPLRDGGRS